MLLVGLRDVSTMEHGLKLLEVHLSLPRALHMPRVVRRVEVAVGVVAVWSRIRRAIAVRCVRGVGPVFVRQMVAQKLIEVW